MRTHRDGPRIAFRDDAPPGQEVVGWVIIALVFAYTFAVAVGIVPPNTKRSSALSVRIGSGGFAAVLFLAGAFQYWAYRHWCEIDHETWTLRLIRGPWLNPGRSTLVQEIQVRDIAAVHVDVTPNSARGDLHYVVLVMRAGDRIPVPCLEPKSDAAAVQADADALSALLWPSVLKFDR